MNMKRFKNYIFKVFVLEVIVFILAAVLWLFRLQHGTPFYLCLFMIGVIFIGLGTLFLFNAKNAIFDDFQRRKLGLFTVGSSMTDEESKRRTSDDIDTSYFQGSLFLWAGLIAAGLSLAYDFFQNA
jgi:hypothetical protein